MAEDTEAPPNGSSTPTEQPKKPNPIKGNKPFKKGDPRINRKGRPKSFDALRELAQQIAKSQATKPDGTKVVIDGHLATQAEQALFRLAILNPDRFLFWAYGYPPPATPLPELEGLIHLLPKDAVTKLQNGATMDSVAAALLKEFLAKAQQPAVLKD